jgi:O-antigen/teichoic acid export membrane protein
MTMVFQLGGQAASVIVGVALARLLGPAGKGTTAYAMVALSLVTMYFNGQNEAIAYQFGRRRLSIAAVHRAMFHIFAITAPLCMLIMIGIGFGLPSQHALIAAALALPFALYAQFATQFLLVIGRTLTANILALSSTLLYAMVITPLLLWGHAGTREALIVWVGALAAGALYAWYSLRPYITGKRQVLRDAEENEEPELELSHGEVFKEQFVFMGKAGFSSFASYLNLRIDVFIVSIMLGAAELGVYTLAIATGELMWKVGQAITWSALGRIASETPERSAEMVAKVTRNIFALQFVFALVVFIAAPPLITFVYGPAFNETSTTMRLLLPGLTAYLIEGPIGYFFSVQKGNPTFRLVVQSCSIGICAVVTFLAIPRFSIYGAAVATSVSYLCVVAIMTVLFTRSTNVSVWELFFLQRSDFERYGRLLEGLKKNLASALRRNKSHNSG